MRKNKNTALPKSLNAADGVVLVLCLCGAFLSFLLFWNDLNQTLERQLPAVGIITFKRGSAERRFHDRVLWNRLRQESPVHEGDFIHTAAFSDATVTFRQGRQISLAENSLVRIRTRGGRPVIDLAAGDISVESPGENLLVVVAGNKEIELSGRAKARVAEDGEFDLQVLEGSAAIHLADQVIIREAGQDFSVDSRGSPAARPRVIMSRPVPDEQFTASAETLEIEFSWMPVNFTPAGSTRLEIAADRRFSRPLQSLEVKAAQARVKLPPGTYWWRAYAADGSGTPEPENAFAEKFTVLPARAPSLLFALPAPSQPKEAPPTPALSPPAAWRLWPEDNYVIGLEYIRRSSSLDFRWNDIEGADGYIFTLKDASGRSILSRGPLTETFCSIDLRGIGTGDFFWQVEAVRRGGAIEPRTISGENRFTLDIPLPGNLRVREAEKRAINP
jgi:hypothetical protein